MKWCNLVATCNKSKDAQRKCPHFNKLQEYFEKQGCSCNNNGYCTNSKVLEKVILAKAEKIIKYNENEINKQLGSNI